VIGTGARQDDWDRHWTDYASAAERNPAQRYRRRLVVSRLRAAGAGRAGARILDLGSGQGDLIAELGSALPVAQLRGIDCSPEGVEIAARKAPSAGFLVRDLLQPGQPPEDMREWATHAVCSEVLEHVDEPVTLLVNARAYLGGGCRLVVTVPGGPMSAFDRHIGHRRHFTVDALRQTLTAAGFVVEAVRQAGFPFFNLYRLVVILRGEKLARDADQSRPLPASARLAMAAFRLLFKLNLNGTGLGWQTFGVFRLRDQDHLAEVGPVL
jgi:2-polyprenyl-3-methyl-5-hydroxy-6-metoxy-1,4-benzoquinol methylase